MNSLDGNKKVSTPEVGFVPIQNLNEAIAKEIISELGQSSIETLKQGNLTSNQIGDIHDRLQQMALQAERLFGKPGDLSDLKIREFIKTQFSFLISSIVETVGNQAPDLIREAGLS